MTTMYPLTFCKKKTFINQECCFRGMSPEHTILLVQPGVELDTRTYTDFESTNECLEVCNELMRTS